MADLTQWDVVLRIVIGALLGGVVGIERETAGQDAGFRTHLLLGLGSALFGVISVGAFDDFVTTRSTTNVTIDVTRIASYVAPGVGFIGGGAILKHRGTVRGITTATSLWTAAAIGLASGVGFWAAAATATAMALVALAVLKPLSTWIDRRRQPPATLIAVLRNWTDGPAVIEALQSIGLPAIRVIQMTPDDDGTTELTLQFWSHPDHDTTRRITTMLSDDTAHIATFNLTT